MTDQDYCSGWRQVRVFTTNTSRFWYPTLLHAVVSPVMEQHWHHDLFVTKYCGSDDGDTSIKDLPPQYLFKQGDKKIHLSVRIRYRANDTIEAKLREMLEHESTLWHYDFRDYDLEADLGGPRFSPSRTAIDSLHRARLIADVLCSNLRVVVDAIVVDGPNIRFEQNQDSLNTPLASTFRSLGHMVCNPWELWEGRPIEVFVCHQERLYPL